MIRSMLSFFQCLVSIVLLVSVSNAAPNFGSIQNEMALEYYGTLSPYKDTGKDNYFTEPNSGVQSYDIEKTDIFIDDASLYSYLQAGFKLNHEKNHGNFQTSSSYTPQEFEGINLSRNFRLAQEFNFDSLTADLNALDINLPQGFTANLFWSMPYNRHKPNVSYTREASPTSHIPEPATLLLFGLGLLGAGFWGRLQKVNPFRSSYKG